jgi:hypothetical protein
MWRLCRTVSKLHTSNATAVGRFDYLCPAEEWLTLQCMNGAAGKTQRTYWTTVYNGCIIKPAKERVQKRPDDDPGKILLRSKTLEHPFGRRGACS